MASPRLYVLDLGRMKMDRSLMVQNWQLANSLDPEPRQQFIEFPVSAYVIDHGEGRILFDAGCNPAAMGENGRWPPAFQNQFPWSGGEACYLPNRLEQLGWGPRDFDHVVLSHMHNDHCGCVEYFNKSKVIVHKDEFSAACRAFALKDDTGPFIRKDTAAWIDADLDWRLIEGWEGDLTLVDGVRILNFGPGHSYGMLGLDVKLAETGRVILVSDALYCAENYAPDFKPTGVVIDSVGWARTARRIHNIAREANAQVWFGHDMNQFQSLIHSTEGYYA